MGRRKFPASIPRRMYWSGKCRDSARCPECGGKIEFESHVYMMAVRHRNNLSAIAVGGPDCGSFCAHCPVVVLNKRQFEDYATMGMGGRGTEFTVLGIIDLDAVPPDKRHLPFDEKTNPTPLVRFLESKQA